MNGSSGLPVGVQIVGLPHGDELCLSVMRDLQQQLHAVFIPNMCALAINKS
jgi:Asp-tRNA(Asn)/Glu-tRNA(Gln) amidotransferase A subunit family amidase